MSARDTTVAMRNARWVMVQRGSQIAGGVLFALIVPRWMGPDEFGRYALVTSISMWFALLTGMGTVSMMTRAVPGFVLRRDLAGLRTLVSGLTGLRAGGGLLAAALYLALTMTWLRDIDVIGLLFIAGAVFSRTVANILLALMLGLNQAARWALGETLRRWLTFVLVVAGYYALGFRGACLGYFAAHAAALVFGAWTAREYVDWRALVPKLEFLAPYLRTGASFAAGNILLALSQRTGETLVHLSTGSFAEVGYFGVAYGVYVAAGQALWHFALSFAPMLVGWKEQGDMPAIRDWISRFAFRLIAGAVALAVLMVLVGRIAVWLVLGSEYTSVAASLPPLAIAMVALTVASISRLRALVADRPGVTAIAAGLELAAFWGVGAILAPAYGSYGAALAVLVGAAVNAGFSTWRLRNELSAPSVATSASEA